MIREICKDRTFLARKSEPATAEDLCVAQDLLETLKAHKEGCVGMAANMIGMNKRIIVFDAEGAYMTMFNPEIIKRSGPLRGGGGLPVSHRYPQDKALSFHQSPISKRKVPNTIQNFYRLDCPNYRARNRPLRGHYHLRRIYP